MEPNALNEFLKDIPEQEKGETDLFKENLAEAPAAEKAEEIPEKDQTEHKNRRHRRWEERLTDREKDLIAREARLEALSESRQFAQEVGSDEVSQKLATLYGTDDNGKRAAQLTKELLDDVRVKAKDEALREIESRNAKAIQEQKQQESFIDTQLESIEDEFNVDVTSDAPAARKARREFLEIVQSLSPKDENGAITGYADFNGAWEMYQLKRSKDTSSTDRKKEIASNSMTRSSTADTSKQEADANLAYLRSVGIQI